MFNQKAQLHYGQGTATAHVGIDGNTILAWVHAALASPDYQLPLPPETAIKLLTLTRQPDTEADTVVKLMEQDPLIAAKVLTVAQSAYFSRGARVTCLRDAVVRLGMEELALLFFEVTATMRIFRAPGFDPHMGSLRRHSALTAQLARVVCRHTSVYEEYAFMCGLLHDVGVAVGASVVARRAPPELAWPAILEVHDQIGGIVSRAWKMPADVSLIITRHHTVKIDGFAHPVACAIGIAEWMAASLGYGLDGESAVQTPEMELRVLGVTEEMCRAMQAEAREIVKRQR